jgi:hypothetical protein
MVDPKIKNSLKKIMTTKAQHTKGLDALEELIELLPEPCLWKQCPTVKDMELCGQPICAEHGCAVLKVELARAATSGLLNALQVCHTALTDGRIGTTDMDTGGFYRTMSIAAEKARAAIARATT